MPKYLLTASYSPVGAKGVVSEGGSSRAAAIEALAGSVGGSVDAVYFALGNDDVIIIADLPDNQTAASIAMTVGATGSVSAYNTTVLLTPAEIDAAAKQSPAYRAPGS